MDKELMKRRIELDEKRNRTERIKAFLLAMLIIAILLHAFWWPVHIDIDVRIPQPTRLYKVEKIVEDEQGCKVSGVNVSLSHDNTGTNIYGWNITNKQHGKATFNNVPYGTYFINCSYNHNGTWYYNGTAWEEIVVDQNYSGKDALKNVLEGFPPET